MRRFALIATLALCAAPAAHAELWGYVDGSGTAHLASRPVDGAYALVLGDVSSDAGRVPGKTDSRQDLLTWLQISPEVMAVQPLLRDAARRTGVDTELLKAVIAVESGYEPRAESPRGALGLMQITPEAGQRYAGTRERTALLDPHTNILTGARMLADLMRRFGRIDAALAAWNAGEGTVRRAGGMPDIPETQAHVQMVLELYWALLQRSLPAQAKHLKIEP